MNLTKYFMTGRWLLLHHKADLSEEHLLRRHGDTHALPTLLRHQTIRTLTEFEWRVHQAATPHHLCHTKTVIFEKQAVFVDVPL